MPFLNFTIFTLVLLLGLQLVRIPIRLPKFLNRKPSVGQRENLTPDVERSLNTTLSADHQTKESVDQKTKVCVLTATTSRLGPGSGDMPLPKYAIASLVNTLEPEFAYTLYVGYDSDDLYYTQLDRRLELDALAQPVSIRWIECDNPSHKPGPVFNNVSAHAVAEGCDYLF